MFKLKQYREPYFSKYMRCPDAVLKPVTKDGTAPVYYHSMSIYPEYFKINGKWLLARESRMDVCAVYADGEIKTIEFRNLRKDDLVICGREEDGSEGILVWTHGFDERNDKSDAFSFRQNRTRETSFACDYEELKELLGYEKEHGKIVWVLGPAVSFDDSAKKAFSWLIGQGYVDALLAGNALATHDLEGAYLHTALGQDIVTRENVRNGHYNHLDTINRIRSYGSIPAFLKEENIQDGIIYTMEKYQKPYVLAGSIRDDGPLPPVYGNVYDAQDAMRKILRDATTVISVATMLHSIAVGNMTPSYRVLSDGTVREVYFYCVDASEFTLNKLSDRGSLSSHGIVTNAQDFMIRLKNVLEQK